MHVIKSAMACISQEDISKPAYKPTPEMIKKAQQKYYEKNKENIMAQKSEYIKKRRETDPDYAAKLCEYQRRKNEKIRTNPELVEKRRIYMRSYLSKKYEQNPELLEKRKEYQRTHYHKTKQPSGNISSSDSNSNDTDV